MLNDRESLGAKRICGDSEEVVHAIVSHHPGLPPPIASFRSKDTATSRMDDGDVSNPKA